MNLRSLQRSCKCSGWIVAGNVAVRVYTGVVVGVASLQQADAIQPQSGSAGEPAKTPRERLQGRLQCSAQSHRAVVDTAHIMPLQALRTVAKPQVIM
jgi:hypothetical protein